MANAQKATNEFITSELKEIKTQLGRVFKNLNERELGKFPSNTTNPREHVKAITLRSGKEVKNTKEVKSQTP